jgi:hypothetical protein
MLPQTAGIGRGQVGARTKAGDDGSSSVQPGLGLFLLMISPVAMLVLGILGFGERALRPPAGPAIAVFAVGCALFIGYYLAVASTRHWALRVLLGGAFAAVILVCYATVALFGGCAAICAGARF